MFFDISPLEMVVLVVLAVVIFGPDKLPKVISEVARFIRKIREFSENAKHEIRSELGPEFADLDLQDLNPKAFLRKQIALHGDDYGRQEIRELSTSISKDTRAAAASVRAVRAQGLDQVVDNQVASAPSADAQSREPSPQSSERN